MLSDNRVAKVSELVEKEYLDHDRKKKGMKSHGSKNTISPSKNSRLETEEEPEEQLFSLKCENRLLPSHIKILEEIFVTLDKYNDDILKRSDYILKLRTDPRVVDFIDADAVYNPVSKECLNLDQILREIEADETQEIANNAYNGEPVNHKEFITWREFMSYFDEYQPSEERNKQQKAISEARKSVKTDREKAEELRQTIEEEKERRVNELPRFRPEDQIDAEEQHLELLRDIFDSLPRFVKRTTGQEMEGHVASIDFFVQIRRDPQVKTILTTLAREPDGVSRLPRESFQQVFDRMERDWKEKSIDWPTIVEFFTKRGRPLTVEEMALLHEQDRLAEKEYKDAIEKKQREDEEAFK